MKFLIPVFYGRKKTSHRWIHPHVQAWVFILKLLGIATETIAQKARIGGDNP